MSHLNPSALVIPSDEKTLTIPRLLGDEGETLVQHVLSFFAATLENDGTRDVYARSIFAFLHWAADQGATLQTISPPLVAAYLSGRKQLGDSDPTRKNKLSALRSFFGWLVEGGFLPLNPCLNVRGPKVRVEEGKTPVLSGAEMRQLLDSIDTSTLRGQRDKALISTMAYTFARVSTALGAHLQHLRQESAGWSLQLKAKGGRHSRKLLHHEAAECLLEYLDAGEINDPNAPIFQSFGGKGRRLSGKVLSRQSTWTMTRQRALDAGLPPDICTHTFRASGITAFMENGGMLDTVRRMADHADARTTQLYIRTSQAHKRSEVERVRFE